MRQAFVHNDAFIAEMEHAVHYAKSHGQHGAVLVIAITNFPLTLANYGQACIEQTAAQLVEEIGKLLETEGKIFRTDSANFSVIFPSAEKLQHYVEEIHHFIQYFGATKAVAPIFLSAVMGSARFPADNAVENAHIALDMARKEPFRYHLAYEQTDKRQLHGKHQMVLANYLQNAVLNKRLRLAFQPVINSQTGHVIYHESLLRVVDDNGKISSAGPFIPVAESLGFIDVIDDIVLEMVTEELRNSPDIVLAFNISNLTVDNEPWLRKAKHLLKDSSIASRMVVEMTETAIYGDMKKVSNFVVTLQGLGCQIAVDDFGAGYTSFRQLKSLPVDIVKIDGYFVKDIVDNSDNLLFVKTLLEFTRGLGLKAVAEFVETGEIAKLLMELKVDYMQGNYFCPAVNYRSWIKEERYG